MNETTHKPGAAFSFAVLSLFYTGPERRGEYLRLLHNFVVTTFRGQLGLDSVELFTDESDGHIVMLSRWRERTAYEAFKQSASGRQWSEWGLTLQPKAYFLRSEVLLQR